MMTDPTFDPFLAGKLRLHAERGLSPFDPRVIAQAAIASPAVHRRRPDLRLLAVAAVVLLGGILAATFAAGAQPPVGESAALVVDFGEATDVSGPRSAWRFDISTGRASAIVTGRPLVSVAPDGRHVTFRDGTDLHLVDVSTGMDNVLTGVMAGRLLPRGYDDALTTDDSWRDIIWSPGGRWVSWMSCLAHDCAGTVAASDGSGTNPMPGAAPDTSRANTPTWWWIDDDRLVEGRFGDVRLADGDGSNIRECPTTCQQEALGMSPSDWGSSCDQASCVVTIGGTDPPIQIPTGSSSGQVMATVDGSRAAVALFPGDPSTTASQLWLVQRDGTKIVPDLGPDVGPRSCDPDVMSFSPDEARLLVQVGRGDDPSCTEPGIGTRDAVVVDTVDGRVIGRFDDVAFARWSPDGTQIALVRASDPRQVELVAPDGTNRRPVGKPAGGIIDQLVWIR